LVRLLAAILAGSGCHNFLLKTGFSFAIYYAYSSPARQAAPYPISGTIMGIG
jgi:hypothetical protein